MRAKTFTIIFLLTASFGLQLGTISHSKESFVSYLLSAQSFYLTCSGVTSRNIERVFNFECFSKYEILFSIDEINIFQKALKISYLSLRLKLRL